MIRAQFDEIFGGREGDGNVKHRLYEFLRQVDDFLQFVTLGISPTSCQNEEVTTAEYHGLPAPIGPVEGTGTSK